MFISIPEVKSELRQANLDRHTSDQEVLYNINRDATQIEPGALYERYEQEVEDYLSKRMICNHLRKLQHYNHIVAEGQTRGGNFP